MKTMTEDGRIFIDMPSDESNPCLDCGACCAHFRISFYNGESDELPNGFVPHDMITSLNPVMSCMRGTELGNGRCIALTGDIGKNIGCSIYSNRPSPCREYPVWLEDGTPNPQCQKLRAKIGKPALVHQNS